MHTRVYKNGTVEKSGFPVADVSDYVCDPGCVVWFDLCAPTEADLGVIGEELGLHELAVEDVLNDHQRPKLDIYESHLFLTVYSVHLDDEGMLDPVEINIFVTRNALVTVRENDRFDIYEVVKRWDAGKGMAGHGVSYLLHGLLDYVVDGHFALVQELDAQVEDLEDALFGQTGTNRDLQRRHFALRKNMVRFRKVILPMREVVNALLRRDLHVAEGEMTPYYQDVYDHVLRVAEWIDSLRELVGNLREAHLAEQGFRLNEIMKRLTGWAAIIAVPTAITGFYGQNVPYPGEGQLWGFWASTLVVALASVALYTVFKKKDWL
ncbi:magnesium transporter CorA family protein [Nonomuraea sp. NBC_01738]|uniref:magnesium transporter CorA family protein n=1 Tax=Nonomuraea sp. NBC_01738 TaxID=2976003 RepID=UPI002E13EEDA|nr:magnesium transporter CorA family protein [Nonomuraea sp. NBC_01738]